MSSWKKLGLCAVFAGSVVALAEAKYQHDENSKSRAVADACEGLVQSDEGRAFLFASVAEYHNGVEDLLVVMPSNVKPFGVDTDYACSVIINEDAQILSSLAFENSFTN